nr:c1q globular head like domain containing protein [uncultured Mediterranean phage uvMED]
MAYIGKTPVIGNFVKLDAITAVNGQAAYTMQNGGSNFTDYESVNQFLVSLNGTIQAPTSSFTVSGSTLTFASNLATGDVIDFIMVFGNSLSAGTPTDSTVSTAKIVDDAVTAAKINNDIISGSTELASEPADTDEFLVSNAGTLKRIDYSLIKGGGITEADMYRKTATSSDSDVNPVTDWERVDDATFSKLGTGISVSSGIFSFPSTGLYLVKLKAFTRVNSGNYDNLRLRGSNDGFSSNDDVLGLQSHGVISSGNPYQSNYIETFFNCTNVSTHKVKVVCGLQSAQDLYGDTNDNVTTICFIRLGDSQ